MSRPPQSQSFYGTPSGITSKIAPAPIIASRDPASSDTGYPLSQPWVNKSSSRIFFLASVSGGIANWKQMDDGTSDVNTLTGNSGVAVPVAGNINVLGGTNLTSAGASPTGDDLTLNMDAAITLATSVTAPLFDSAASMSILAAAGSGISIGSPTSVSVVANSVSVELNPSAPSVNRATNLAGGTVSTASVTDTLNLGSGGVSTNADSIRNVNINVGTVAVGQLNTNINSATVTSGTNLVSIQTGNRVAGTVTLNMCTGTGTKAVNVGNADGLTTLTLSGATNQAVGNITLVAAGAKLNRTSVASTTAAGANSVGTVTLVAGVATIATTSVTSSSIIKLDRQGVGLTGAAALGYLSKDNIVDGVSFDIRAVQPANAGAAQTTDVSVIAWEIVN